jgi:hypothetical protein
MLKFSHACKRRHIQFVQQALRIAISQGVGTITSIHSKIVIANCFATFREKRSKFVQSISRFPRGNDVAPPTSYQLQGINDMNIQMQNMSREQRLASSHPNSVELNLYVISGRN